MSDNSQDAYEWYKIIVEKARNAVILRDESSMELVEEIAKKHDIPVIVIEYLIAWAYETKDSETRAGEHSPKNAIKQALNLWDYFEDKKKGE